ncbi:hypothetical protein [Larkinella soli]|nr:hypothetical protein [Larkinella soli]
MENQNAMVTLSKEEMQEINGGYFAFSLGFATPVFKFILGFLRF